MNILYVSEIREAYPFVVTVEFNNVRYNVIVDIPPMVFRDHTKQNIPNIDQWIFKESATQYTYSDFVNFAKSFRAGYESAILNDKSKELIRLMVRNIIDKIFNTRLIAKFKSAYRIELLDFSSFVHVLDNLRTAKDINNDILPFLINKLYKYAEINCSDYLEAVERIAEKYHVDIDKKLDDGLTDTINSLINDEFDSLQSTKLCNDAQNIMDNIYGHDMLEV